MPASTALSPHAPLQHLGAANARWVSGFWGDITARTREVTVPGMWESLRDPAISPGLRNFRLAAGLEEGEHTGPPFMDGDLYKWLEAAIAELEIAPDPALAETVESVAALIASVQRDDGYVHTPTLIAARHHQNALALADRFHFETYNLGHLITAGVRHYEVTGSTTLLDVARGAARFLENLADERAGRARSQRDLPVALHGRDRPLPRDARRAVPSPRRGVRARARRLPGRRRQPGPPARARSEGGRRPRGARELPVRGAGRHRRRDGRRRAAGRARSTCGATSSTPSSTSPAAAERCTTARRPTATRGRRRSAASTRPTVAPTSCPTRPRTPSRARTSA